MPMSSAESEPAFPDLLAALDLPRIPQQARSRMKRDALLAAAARLFAERGYEATTTDEIAEAAGVSVGTCYAYFRNKRQLLLAMMANSLASIEALHIPEISFGLNPRSVIRETVERGMIRDRAHYGLRRAWQELLPRDPELADYDQRVQKLVHRQMVEAVRRAAAQGLTWPDLDIEATCWAITQLLDQVWYQPPPANAEAAAALDRQGEALADLIYRAIFRAG